jgi:parvulin-like peptidyl-prolyl isomerase
MVMAVLRSKKFAKRVLLALLVLIIPAFVLWGVGNVGQRQGLVGRIGGKKIYAPDLAKSAQGVKVQVLLTYFNDAGVMNSILQNRPLINSMSWERLVLLDAAQRKRIKVPNKEIMFFISGHPLFRRNGVFDMQVYNYMLRNMLSMEPQQFEKTIMENLKVRKFRQSLFKDIVVDEEEVLLFYKQANDKVSLSYVLIDRDLFADNVNIDPEKVKKYYRENKEGFFSPAKADIEYVELPYGDSPQKEFVEKVKTLYEKFRKAPEDFRKIAEENGLLYGATGLFSREELIPGIKSTKRLHDIAFTLKEGEVSPPIPSGSDEGSIYILHKTQHIAPSPLEFEMVEEKITEKLKMDECLRQAKEKADQLYEKIITGDMKLEDAGKTIGQNTLTAAEINSSNYVENVGPAVPIVTHALKGAEGKVTPPITVKKGVLLVRVDKIFPTDTADFEKKKDALHQNILTRKQMDVMDKWFRANASKIKLEGPLDEH